jgi:hypothetical protein
MRWKFLTSEVNANTSDSQNLDLKNMALSMRNMEDKIKDLEAKVKNTDSVKETVQKLEIKVDRSNQLGEQLYTVTNNFTSTKMHTITTSDEAALPAFSGICEELVRLT